MPRGFISRGYADIFGYIYIIVETRRPNQRVLLFERKKRVSVETLFLRSILDQRLLNFKDLVLALPTIWSFLRFQPDFWLNIAVFLHIRF